VKFFEHIQNLNSFKLVSILVLRRYWQRQTPQFKLIEATKKFIRDKNPKFDSTRHGRQLIRNVLIHTTDSYGLIVQMEYYLITETDSVDISNLDQPAFDQMLALSFWCKKY